MKINHFSRRKLLESLFQTFHFLIVFGFLIFGLVEFVSNPPYFDGYGDAKDSHEQLPKGLFLDDPRVSNESAYFAVSSWLRYQGLSWLLTASMCMNLVCFFVVNFWYQEFFSWKYYSSRNNGLDLQVLSLTLSVTLIFMVIFYTRQKMPFKLKSSLRIQAFGKIHLMWNFSVIFIVCFTCLLLWFSKLYISWACFKTQAEVMKLCEKTNMVQCYLCEGCNFDAFSYCAKNVSHYQSFHCESPRNSTTQRAFCIFNYNVGTYTFLTVFAYVGGLCIFLATFLQIIFHYIIRLFIDSSSFLRNIYSHRRGRQMFVTPEDIQRLSDGETELYHPSTDETQSRCDISRENGLDENDLGNILINASIG